MFGLLVPEFESVEEPETLLEGSGFSKISAGGGGRDSLRSPYAVLPAQRDSHSKTEKHFRMSCAYHSATR